MSREKLDQNSSDQEIQMSAQLQKCSLPIPPPRLRLACALLTFGRALNAAVKQSTAFSYSPLRLKRTPRPHCTSGSTAEVLLRTAAKNSSFTSTKSELQVEKQAHVHRVLVLPTAIPAQASSLASLRTMVIRYRMPIPLMNV